jgi:hypothetical protein
MAKKKTHEEFLQQVKVKRPDVTVKSKYINSISFVTLKCECGWEYQQRPNNLLQGTKGCPICGNSGNRNQTSETFIAKAKNIHGNTYSYEKTLYKKAIEKVEVICFVHGSFFVTPHNHLTNKTGCPKCNSTQRWSYSEWETVGKSSKHFDSFKFYKIRCYDKETGEEFLKLGKTYRSIGTRCYDIPYEYEVLEVVEGSANFISNLEITKLNQLKQDKYTPFKPFKGMTECFRYKGDT